MPKSYWWWMVESRVYGVRACVNGNPKNCQPQSPINWVFEIIWTWMEQGPGGFGTKGLGPAKGLTIFIFHADDKREKLIGTYDIDN